MQSTFSNPLDWLLALLPILAILILMLRFRWGGAQAGPVGWLVASFVAALRFGTGWQVLACAQLKGLLLTLYVLYVIWTALLFYRVTDEAGVLKVIASYARKVKDQVGSSRDSGRQDLIAQAESELAIVQEKSAVLNTLVDENSLRFMLGTKPLSEWDAFIKDVKAQNPQELVDIFNAALKRYNAAGK